MQREIKKDCVHNIDGICDFYNTKCGLIGPKNEEDAKRTMGYCINDSCPHNCRHICVNYGNRFCKDMKTKEVAVNG